MHFRFLDHDDIVYYVNYSLPHFPHDSNRQLTKSLIFHLSKQVYFGLPQTSILGNSHRQVANPLQIRVPIERLLHVGFEVRFGPINSLIRITEVGSGCNFICSVVLPWAANIESRRLSVLSAVGAALLGESVGQVVMCRGRNRLLLMVAEELIERSNTVPQLLIFSHG